MRAGAEKKLVTFLGVAVLVEYGQPRRRRRARLTDAARPSPNPWQDSPAEELRLPHDAVELLGRASLRVLGEAR